MLSRHSVDFDAVNRAAKPLLAEFIRTWLPDGRQEGHEWLALNPTRGDRNLGSFKINLVTGQWADFATGDSGGDIISLAAYLRGISQLEAARRLADLLGVGYE